ncbi:uncharacterized protein N0V89_002413 [Didymosphaeria variabile]|uniref:Uncharacterized protein n=1 Tax=Didymosphaeria variabile TaxID=1932322 RepID=A0A9W8XRL2_9PLEO|nr:uncharacterized protein N0V89_002413 [Didymosphaeria variabile]KAJ4357837.1 hypothetical protein N0V89_002413 [Didymosphaeria variabile]
MDIDMDIDYDASAQHATETTQQINETIANDASLPAAYYENLDERPGRQVEQWPESLNLQGVDNFDPSDAIYYLIESGVPQKIKQQRWVNDSSLNLQFHSAEDASLALQQLTDPEAGDPASIPADAPRKAKPYKDRTLIIRQANSGDQKLRGAANQSKYYERNPDVRGGERRGDRGREREPRRRAPPRRDFLDYGEEEPARDNMRRYSGNYHPAGNVLTLHGRSGDEQMRDGSDYENRRNRRNGNRNRDDGRLRASDVDSYRPGSKSPRESRFGRLRGRSASPASGDEGDGRYGFTEAGTSTRRQYRSRSRSRNNRRRKEPSVERWTHDRANYDREQGPPARWAKDTSTPRYGDAFSSESKHRRSDAFDETANRSGGSLLSRMTKDGQPLAAQGRSLASRITRDTDDSSYGRLKDDDSTPSYADFPEPAPRRGLASRITRDDDDLEGINIRGTASQGGFSIRGVAGGA